MTRCAFTYCLVAVATSALLIMTTESAWAVTQIYNGANGAFNTDSWNVSARWNSGVGPVPSGTDDVEIAAGTIPWAVNATGSYSGSLTLKTNSTLGIGPTAANNTVNALGNNVNTRTITMESGSRITMRVGAAYTFNQNFTLLGAATLAMAESTSGHNQTRTFASPISGAFTLTILGNNGNTVNLNTANGFSSLNMTADDRYRLFLNAAGAAGTGDVTMRNRTSQEGMRGGTLVINSAANTIADTAKLTLNNIGYDGTTNDGAVPRAMVVMNENETVGSLEVNVPTTLTPMTVPQPTSLRFLSGDSTLKVNGTATFNGPSAAMQMFNTSALTVGDLTFNDNAGWNITGNTLTIDTSGGGNGTITANVDATISSILAGSAPITKLGTGTLLLTSAGNTHSGSIDIQAGTLALGAVGSISNSTSVGIAAGAEFDTTAQSFSMIGSQPFTFEIDPTGAGLAGLLDAATLDITAGDVSFDLLGALDDPDYVFASYSSLLGASFSSVALPAGYVIDYNYLGGNVIALVQQAEAVPEPTTLALWSLLGLGLVVGVRRGKNSRLTLE